MPRSLNTLAVVLVTPNETDAHVGTGFLQDAGIEARTCSTLAELCLMPLDGVGCVVLVEEALIRPEVDDFLSKLEAH